MTIHKEEALQIMDLQGFFIVFWFIPLKGHLIPFTSNFCDHSHFAHNMLVSIFAMWQCTVRAIFKTIGVFKITSTLAF